MKAIRLLVIAAILGGCATPLKPNETGVTIVSFPRGATISAQNCNGIGTVDCIYTLPAGQHSGVSPPVTVRWVSGATASATLTLVAGTRTTYTIRRPNVPGADADIQWAIHLDQQDAALRAQTAQSIANATNSMSSSSNWNATPNSSGQDIDRGVFQSQKVSGTLRYCTYSRGAIVTVGVADECPR